MTPMDMLLSRASTDHLKAPAPSETQMAEVLAAAMRAPDHGKLRPWRYVIVKDDARPYWPNVLLPVWFGLTLKCLNSKKKSALIDFPQYP